MIKHSTGLFFPGGLSFPPFQGFYLFRFPLPCPSSTLTEKPAGFFCLIPFRPPLFPPPPTISSPDTFSLGTLLPLPPGCIDLYARQFCFYDPRFFPPGLSFFEAVCTCQCPPKLAVIPPLPVLVCPSPTFRPLFHFSHSFFCGQCRSTAHGKRLFSYPFFILFFFPLPCSLILVRLFPLLYVPLLFRIPFSPVLVFPAIVSLPFFFARFPLKFSRIAPL